MTDNVPYPSPPHPDVYYGLTGDLIETVEPITESDPPTIALQFLVAIGNIIGRQPYFLVGDKRHGVNEFALIIGNTAHGRKGDGMARALVIPGHADDDWCIASE